MSRGKRVTSPFSRLTGTSALVTIWLGLCTVGFAQLTASTVDRSPEVVEFYRVRSRGPWGALGNALGHGYSEGLPDKDQPLRIRRAGPYVPMFTLPTSALIVTDEGRRVLESAGLRGGFRFREVQAIHVAELNWGAWDRESRVPPELPPMGRPTSYFDERPNSPAAAAEMGPLWEVQLSESTVIDRVNVRLKGGTPIYGTDFDLSLRTKSWSGADLFIAHKEVRPSDKLGRAVIVTAAGKKILEDWADEWFRFERCLTTDE